MYCRDCKRSVDDCEHFVAPIGSPHVTVFDPKVQSLAYEKKSMILEVEFKNGQVWQLFGIKPEIYEELLHATLSSFLKFLAHRYRAAPVRRLRPGAIVPTSEPCPACQRPMTEMHKTSGGTIRVLWHCDKCNQSLWRTYQRESIRERRRR